MDSAQLQEVLRRVEHALDKQDAALIRAVFASYAFVAEVVEDKNSSIRRLRQLFFGGTQGDDRGRGGDETRDRGAASGGARVDRR